MLAFRPSRLALAGGLALATAAALAAPVAAAPVGPAAFPSSDAGYHDHGELTAELDRLVAAHPALVSKRSIGRSYEGRDLWLAKVSDNVAVDEAEPEVLIVCGQHAREHLSVEGCLDVVRRLTGEHATDPRVRGLVDGREVWVVANANPDGSEYDTAGGSYRSWRKNRQPNSGSTSTGTDLDRNWGYAWGQPGASSAPAAETFHGAAAFSAPETAQIRDFVRSRVLGGVQQIKAGLDIQARGERVLWPFSHTAADTPLDMGADQRETFAVLAASMAAGSGYAAAQAGDVEIASGTMIDWLWGSARVFGFTMEMYPGAGNSGYPPDEVIAAQTGRNREAVLRLLEAADCPYEVIGRQSQHCGLPGPSFRTDTDVPIPDVGTGVSPLDVSGLSGSTTSVVVRTRFVHGNPGALLLTLVAPDGSGYLVGTPAAPDAAVTVPVTAASRSGRWHLLVQDITPWSTGYLDAWSVTF